MTGEAGAAEWKILGARLVAVEQANGREHVDEARAQQTRGAVADR